MRIFQILERTTNVAVPGNAVWIRNLHDPLVDAGHDVVLVPAEDGRRAMQTGNSRLRAAFSQRILEAFRREHARRPFDLVFAYLMDGMVDPGVIDDIRAVGVPTCNFSCNNVHQFDLVDGLAPHFDFNLHSERDVGPKFAGLGARPLWFQMAANPRYYYPRAVLRDIDVSFVGSNYALRAQYLFTLLESGFDVQIYGPGWTPRRNPAGRWLYRQYLLLRALTSQSVNNQARYSREAAQTDLSRLLLHRYSNHLHPPIDDEAMFRLYSASNMSLGFLEVHEGHDLNRATVQHLHLREFEAPMSGALYCTNYSEELAEHYEPDVEVITFRNVHELVDKVAFYLKHPGAAEKVRRAARARALQDHTWQRRFEKLFDTLNLRERV